MNTTTPVRPSALKVAVRWDAFDALTELRGWHNDAQRAEGLGLARSTIRRLRSRANGPGENFIVAALAEFRVPFEALFELVAE